MSEKPVTTRSATDRVRQATEEAHGLRAYRLLEPEPSSHERHGRDEMEGEVLVQMRSIVLDISRLVHGTYRLQLAAKKAGVAAVTSERVFVLR